MSQNSDSPQQDATLRELVLLVSEMNFSELIDYNGLRGVAVGTQSVDTQCGYLV